MRVVRWVLKGAGLLVAAAGIFVAIAYVASEHAMRRTYELARIDLAVTGDAAQLQHGRHLAVTRGCADCHGADLGGKVMIDAFPVGRLAGSNLTPGGLAAGYGDAELEHAIRHGVDADGKPLLFMPSEDYFAMSDDDVAALIAYLKSVPSVERDVGESRAGPLARVLWLTGAMPLLHAERVPHDLGSIAAPVAAVTTEYGRYIAQTCVGCHGAGFGGGAVPGVPPSFPHAANLTLDDTGLKRWSEHDFVAAMRTGRRPDGRTLDEFMPWKAIGQMTDVELRALWAYLVTLPPKPAGTR